MRKSKLIYIMAIVILLTGCKQKQENRIEIPAYILNTNYERTPVKAIPLGEYKTIVADEGNTIFVGTDPKIIPTGTFLFIHNVGMRVVVEDKTAKGKMIVFYEPAPETVFIYAIVKNKSEKGTPYYKEL